MYGVRSALEADFNAMKRDLEIKMSGRKGTGHNESGAIETLNKKVSIIEKKWTTSRTSRRSSATMTGSLA